MLTTKLTPTGSIWAGTLEALNQYIEGNAVQKKYMGEPFPEGGDDHPRLLQVMGTTAIVRIQGTLVTHENWWDEWAGRVSYASIRRAVTHALMDENIDRILLMIDSGGGQVNGVSDLTSFLGKAAKIKPLLAHTSGQMCSAAYWIGSCASYVSASETANIGSIGTVMIQAEITEALAKEGVNVTVIRSGPYKYLGNQYEKLSETALAEMQNDIQATESVFVKCVAKNRGKGEDYVRQQMGQGRVYIANTAKDVGLIDAVYSYDDVMSKILSGAFDDMTSRTDNTIIGSTPMQTEEQRLAALQAMAAQGITVEGEVTSTPPTPTAKAEEPEEPEVNAESGKQAQEPEVSAGRDTTSDTYVAKLEAKLAENEEKIVELKVSALSDAKTIQNLEASIEPLKKIVAQSAKNLATGLGQQGADFSNLDVQALVAQHNTLATTFTEKFKAGGVSAVEAKTKDQATSEGQDLESFQKLAKASTKLA